VGFIYQILSTDGLARRGDIITAMRKALPAALALVVVAAAGCGDSNESTFQGVPVPSDPGPVHVHGLGINPSDGALFIATHTGLFRVADGGSEAVRVADRYQDTMGFTVVGPDRFLGSGHPDARDGLPPFLGLIESRDAAETWKPLSLLGESDFHALEARGERVYGFGSDWKTRKAQFLVSSDGGKSWDELDFPEEFLSLDLHPSDPDRILGSGPSATWLSTDAGRQWRRLASGGGLVAWPSPDEMVRIDPEGTVWGSDSGATWVEVGSIGSQPAALEAERDGLYVALHDGTIKRSTDGGASWTVRYQPNAGNA
jgi:hypothetical protein